MQVETFAEPGDALDEIVRLEPRTGVFGQVLSSWLFWRPADARLDDLRRELVPQLPRLRKLMDRALTEWTPQTLDSRRNELQAQLETADEPPPLPQEMADLYRQKVTTLAQALEHVETRPATPRPHRRHHPDARPAHAQNRTERKSGGDAERRHKCEEVA